MCTYIYVNVYIYSLMYAMLCDTLYYTFRGFGARCRSRLNLQAGCIGGTLRTKLGADSTRSRSTCVPRYARHPPLQPRPSGSVRVLATTVQSSTGNPLSPTLYCTSIDHCCHAVDRRTSGCPHPVRNLDGARHSAYPNANFRVPHGEPATLGLKSNISRHHQTHNEHVPHEGPHLELSL